MLHNRLFFALASRSGFGATISDAIARSSLVFCNSVSAHRIGMAASRLLLALAACVMSFGVRKVQCEVWSVKTLLRLSLKKSNGCRGKDTVGTGCL